MHWLLVASVLAAAQGGAEGALSPEEQKKLEEEIAKELGQAPQPSAPGAAQPQAPPAASAPAAGAQGEPPAPPSAAGTGGNPFARLMLLPDISAIGSAALAYNQLDVASLSPRGDPFAPSAGQLKPLFQELELGIQAVVDPYARADVFLSFASEGVEVEEAYLTTLQLPAGLQVRAGKLFAPVGRLNQQHGHVWTFVDRPLALARLLGPDALKGPGLDVAWLAPTPWFAEVHLAYLSATPGFETAERNGGYARLAQFFDLGEAETLGVGISGGWLDEPGSGAWRRIYGADAFLKVRPPSSRSYLALQGELLLRTLDANGGATDLAGSLWGGYLQASVRDGPYWEFGARAERAPATGLATGAPEVRYAALATWLPSEFQRLRGQLAWARLPGGQDGLEALLQVEFAIGAHGAHPF
jgi:hypothetical protein